MKGDHEQQEEKARALLGRPRRWTTGWGLLDGGPRPQNPVPKIGLGFTGTADWVDQLCGWTLNLGDDRLGPRQPDWPLLQVKPHPSHGRPLQRHWQRPNCLSNAASRHCDSQLWRLLWQKGGVATKSRSNWSIFLAGSHKGSSRLGWRSQSSRRSIPSFISPQQSAQAMVGLLGQPGQQRVVICKRPLAEMAV